MKRILKSLSALCILGILFSGCVQEKNIDNNTTVQESSSYQEKNQDNINDKIEGIVSINGSTTVQPVAQSIADAFNEIQPDISVEVQGTGSSVGIKSVYEGSADIGTASRELKEEEKAWDLTEHIIAYDGIAIIVHSDNKIENLTQEQIKKIFTGEIKNWKEVGGEDENIIVISREDGSGTRDAFKEILGIEDFIPNALISNSNGAVKTTLASKKGGIAYISLGIVDDTVKALNIDNVTPSSETVKNKEYKISRPLLMLTSKNPSDAVKAYIDFVLSDEGQNIVSEHYITVK